MFKVYSRVAIGAFSVFVHLSHRNSSRLSFACNSSYFCLIHFLNAWRVLNAWRKCASLSVWIHASPLGLYGDRAKARRDFVQYYLTSLHRDDPGAGCPLPSLSCDVARAASGSSTRAAFVDGLSKLADKIAPIMDGQTKSERRCEALAMISMLVGAVALSRATQANGSRTNPGLCAKEPHRIAQGLRCAPAKRREARQRQKKMSSSSAPAPWSASALVLACTDEPAPWTFRSAAMV